MVLWSKLSVEMLNAYLRCVDAQEPELLCRRSTEGLSVGKATPGAEFLFWFNHTVFTLLRVGQLLSPVLLRAGRLDGGSPLLLPVVPFWQKTASKRGRYIVQTK
jgi:hypothetical protein